MSSRRPPWPPPSGPPAAAYTIQDRLCRCGNWSTWLSSTPTVAPELHRHHVDGALCQRSALQFATRLLVLRP